MMTSKERVLAAIGRQSCDRLPVDYWATPETEAKLLRHYGLSDRPALLDRLGVDIVYIAGPSYVGPELRVYDDGSTDDTWSVRRCKRYTGHGDKRQSYQAVMRSPLAQVEGVAELAQYNGWPRPDDLDYDCIKAQCDAVGDRAVFFMGDRLNRIAQFKPAQYLRGMEKIMMDAALAPELFNAIIGRIKDFYLEYLERILTAAQGRIDVVVTGDDFGAQNGLLISRPMWREFIYPGFKEFIDLSHSFGVPVMHHTCGAIGEIIEDMIEAGLDVLNPLQPGVAGMDHRRIKAQFGDKICFHGGIGIQTNLPFGTPDDIKAEVQNTLTTLGADQTGYIACTAHNIQADTPVANAAALFEAYDQFR